MSNDEPKPYSAESIKGYSRTLPGHALLAGFSWKPDGGLRERLEVHGGLKESTTHLMVDFLVHPNELKMLMEWLGIDTDDAFRELTAREKKERAESLRRILYPSRED